MKTMALNNEPLSVLLPEIQKGEEVLLTSNNRAVAKVVPVPVSDIEKRPHPQPGCLKGTFVMAPDFDAPIEEFKEYMP
jgi:antitoxin (DNA-binding transcriptional repressor) of toxin-antitoxin stability system